MRVNSLRAAVAVVGLGFGLLGASVIAVPVSGPPHDTPVEIGELCEFAIPSDNPPRVISTATCQACCSENIPSGNTGQVYECVRRCLNDYKPEAESDL